MTVLYEETQRIPFCPQKSKQYKVEIEGNDIVVYKATEWKDITKECYAELKASRNCDGSYVAIMHNADSHSPRTMAAIVGTSGITAQHGFKVVDAPGGKYSIKIYRKL